MCGIKGVPHSKKVTDDCDLLISFGNRFSPTFCLGNPKTFAKNAYCVSINNDKDELNLNLKKINQKVTADLETFIPKFLEITSKIKFPNFDDWVKFCNIQKTKDVIPNLYSKKIQLIFIDLCIC